MSREFTTDGAFVSTLKDGGGHEWRECKVAVGCLLLLQDGYGGAALQLKVLAGQGELFGGVMQCAVFRLTEHRMVIIKTR